MSSTTNEASSAVDGLDLSGARTPHGFKVTRNDSSFNRSNSSLPSSAGLSASSSGGGDSSGKRGAKSHQRKEKRKPQNGHGRDHQSGQARNAQQKFEVHNLAREVQSFHCTETYTRAVAKGFSNHAALAKFNQWIENKSAFIDPKSMVVCGQCGSADLVLCEHFVTGSTDNTEVDGQLTINAPLRTQFFYSFQIVDGLKKMLLWPTFDFAQQNNRLLGGFSNSDITDENVVPELYNFVKLRMQTSYKVNGKEDRALRLAHCSRLGMKWVEAKKLNLDCDTTLTNRVMFTVQRVCDNAENKVLYEETDPTQNFLLARAEKIGFLLIFLLQYVFWGRVVSYLLPRTIALATAYVLPPVLRNWVSLFLSILNAMLDGSTLVCYEMIYNPFSSLGVVVAIFAVLSTYLFSINKRR